MSYSSDSLVCCKIRLQPKKLHNPKQKGKPRINTTGMHLPEKVEEFAKSLRKALTVEHQLCSAAEKWNHLPEAIQKTASATFGKKTSKNNDWFDAKFSEMSPVIDASALPLLNTSALPARKPYKHSGQQETKCNRLQGVVQMNTGSS